MSDLQILTNSRSNCFGECHRKHYYRYEMGAKQVNEAENLRFGTLVHACLERWWAYHKGCQTADGNVLSRMMMVYHYLEERRTAGDDPFELAKARVMMDGYEAAWGMVECQTVSVEEKFTAPMLNPDTNGVSRTWVLGGKMDVVAWLDGMLQVVEHKTTAYDLSGESKYWTKLAIDPQVSQYYVGGRAIGHDIQRTTYDVLRKPALRPSQVPVLDADGVKQVFDVNGERVRTKDGKKWRETGDTAQGYTLQVRSETPDEYETRLAAEIMGNIEKYFKRRDVPRLDSDIVEFLGDKWAIGREIADAQRANRWPKNPRSCDSFGTCEFFEVCAGRESIDNPHVFKRVEIHSELLTTSVMESF